MRRSAYLMVVFVVGLFTILTIYNGSSASRKVFRTGGQEEINLAESLSINMLAQRIDRLGLGSIEDLKVQRVEIDDLEMAHTRVQQTYKGIPIFGGEAIVHLNSDGSLFTITNALVSGINVNVEPALSAEAAMNQAVSYYGCRECLTAEPITDMWILRHEGQDRLVYRIQLRREDGSHETSMPVYFVDAQTGELVWNYDNLQTATGASLYSGTVNITTSSVSPNFYMEDLTRRMGTFNFNNGTSQVSRITDTNDVWDSSVQRAAVDAHYGAAMVYDYFKNVHGRTGIDGNGGPAGYSAAANSSVGLISSRVHYSSNYNNAFWNGTFMTYGDGDGSTFTPLVTLDICGHEMQHGITERTANLIYSGESGALNESWSDVFGAMVERYARGESGNTWKIGEDCFTPANGSGDALRYMDNPHAAGNSGFTSDDDPDHYSERYTGSADNGGVHINSGISNKAFYLLAAGGTHHRGGSMTGIGADAAARIWYRALTTYMTQNTNFAGARTATLNAAAAIYGNGSTQFNATCRCWELVGVGTCNTTPPPGGNEMLSNGGFEGSASPWVLSGQANYTNTGAYPQAGTGYVFLGGGNNNSGAVYQQFTIPSSAASANLTFYLNITSSETTTTTQYDKIFVEVRNSAGTLLATPAIFSNLSKASAGVYTLRGPYDLSAYKGQTVRVQFRITTDGGLPTTFRVDTVSVK
ncbi:MAG: M4 family metallopeptidase [Acidobacteriota bacterium]